jgi:signal transduction histidine kinase
MYLPKWWSFAYLGFVPISYFFLRLQPAGGAEDIGSATLDATYILLYALAVQALVTLLRVAAIELDSKNDEFAASALRQAEKDATEFESQKLDELVHDQVLTTILLAAKADTPERKVMAAESASAAIERLQAAASDEVSELQEISVGSFIDSLQESLKRGYPNSLISVTKDQDFSLPINVGIALADATIQAMTNSMQHAGNRAIRQIRLKADRHGLKIVVKDDGKGFWESKIPKNRLGIRNSIRRRATMVGAEVRIESQPRKGATVVLKLVAGHSIYPFWGLSLNSRNGSLEKLRQFSCLRNFNCNLPWRIGDIGFCKSRACHRSLVRFSRRFRCRRNGCGFTNGAAPRAH